MIAPTATRPDGLTISLPSALIKLNSTVDLAVNTVCPIRCRWIITDIPLAVEELEDLCFDFGIEYDGDVSWLILIRQDYQADQAEQQGY